MQTEANKMAFQIHGDVTFYVEARVGSANHRNRGGYNQPCRATWDGARNNEPADEVIQALAKEVVRLSGLLNTGHILFLKGDANIPRGALDGNGDVVLAVCKVCGEFEAGLDQPCKPHIPPTQTPPEN